MTEIDCMWDFNYLAGIQIKLISIMSSAKKQTKSKQLYLSGLGLGQKICSGILTRDRRTRYYRKNYKAFE